MSNRAIPRFETPPTKGSKLNQKVILDAAQALGFSPMPWQRRAIRLLGELRPPLPEEVEQFGPVVAGGLPRYRQVLVTVPRQSGKSTVAQAFVKAKAEEAENRRLYGTSKSRDDARVWQSELNLLLPPEVHYTTAAGRETITWPNGSTYSIFAPNKKGGHGASANGVLIDEAWTLTSEVLQGIIPAMAAQPLAQMLVVTSMGTLESHVWNGLVKAGREAVGDPGASIAYVEYSAENPEDVFDPSKWGGWMPALGITQSRESIKADMAIMEADPNEGIVGVVRAYGNITTAAKVTIFPTEWTDDAWRVMEPPQRMVLAVDVNDDPAGATISSGHITTEGHGAVRVVEWRSGSPRWLPGSVEEIVRGRKVDALAADFGGPAREVKAELTALCEARGVALVDRSPRDVAADTGRFYDALRERSVALERSEPLRLSIDGAVKKTLGDMWLISRRKMAVDASPVISAVLAHALAVELGIRPVAEFFAF